MLRAGLQEESYTKHIPVEQRYLFVLHNASEIASARPAWDKPFKIIIKIKKIRFLDTYLPPAECVLLPTLL